MIITIKELMAKGQLIVSPTAELDNTIAAVVAYSNTKRLAALPVPKIDYKA